MEGLLSILLLFYQNPLCTFTVCVVISERAEAVLAAAAGPSLQVDTVRVLHTAVTLRTEVVTQGTEVTIDRGLMDVSRFSMDIALKWWKLSMAINWVGIPMTWEQSANEEEENGLL